jgi:hypothetical protein
LKGKKRELAAAVLDNAEASSEPLPGMTDEDVEVLLGGLPVAIDVDEEPEATVPRRFVAAREVDELRAILRRVESSGTPRKDLARRVGLPVARVSLLLIGHSVPIPTRAAEKIRALRI